MRTQIKSSMSNLSSTSYGGDSESGIERISDDADNGISQIENRLALLESRMPMPKVGDADEEAVLQLDSGLRPRWGSPYPEADASGNEEHMSLVLVDVSGVLTPQWQYDILQA